MRLSPNLIYRSDDACLFDPRNFKAYLLNEAASAFMLLIHQSGEFDEHIILDKFQAPEVKRQVQGFITECLGKSILIK